MTQEQINALEDMIARRMENTGEDRAAAAAHIQAYLESLL